MSEPQPARVHAPFRVAIVQDLDRVATQQAEMIEAESKRRGLHVAIDKIQLKQPANRILEQMFVAGRGVDWLVVDLLISPIEDLTVLQSSGLNLLRRLRDRGSLHGYSSRSPANADGLRCVAVYSASLAGFGNREKEVRENLLQLGVREQCLFIPGEMRKLAVAVVDELAASGSKGWS
jgi:hypothetical protein